MMPVKLAVSDLSKRFDALEALHPGALAEIIEREIARHPGLYLTGSGFRGVGIPNCVADARATAAQVTEWLEKEKLKR